MRARSKNQGVKRENSWNPCKKYIKGGRCSWCWQMSHGCQNLQKPTGHNTKVRLAGVIMPLVKAFEPHGPHGPHGPHKSRDAPIPSAFCIFVFVKRALGYSLVRILPASSSKSAPNMAVFKKTFWQFEVQTELSIWSRALFVSNFP